MPCSARAASRGGPPVAADGARRRVHRQRGGTGRINGVWRGAELARADRLWRSGPWHTGRFLKPGPCAGSITALPMVPGGIWLIRSLPNRSGVPRLPRAAVHVRLSQMRPDYACYDARPGTRPAMRRPPWHGAAGGGRRRTASRLRPEVAVAGRISAFSGGETGTGGPPVAVLPVAHWTYLYAGSAPCRFAGSAGWRPGAASRRQYRTYRTHVVRGTHIIQYCARAHNSA